MIRATSQQFKFKIPYDISDVDKVNIMFWQEDDNSDEDAVLIVKTKEMCEQLDSRTLCVTLHSEETSRFAVDRKAYVQFRAITQDGFAFGSQRKQLTVYPMKEVADS